MRMRHAAYAATFMLVAALAATILLTSATGPQPTSAAQQTVPHSLAPAPVTPVKPLRTHTLTATAGAGGSVDPAGATTQTEGVPVTLTASWNDATHTFAGWSGDCSGSDTTCTLELYADHSVTATFSELPAARCAQPEDADCIRAVYLGAPDDYPQVQDIPADLLLTPDANGRYEVERGMQVTVVTAAPLPASYTRFYLQQDPVEQPWPVSSSQLIPPVGTTYTFTPSTDPAAADLITFDLHAARPWPFQRPGLKPELGRRDRQDHVRDPAPATNSGAGQFAPTLHRQHPDRAELDHQRRQTALHAQHRRRDRRRQRRITPRQLRAAADGSVHQRPLPDQTKMFSANVSDSQATVASTVGEVTVDLLRRCRSRATSISSPGWAESMPGGSRSGERDRSSRRRRSRAMPPHQQRHS